jgi:hypothetical protein
MDEQAEYELVSSAISAEQISHSMEQDYRRYPHGFEEETD